MHSLVTYTGIATLSFLGCSALTAVALISPVAGIFAAAGLVIYAQDKFGKRA